MPFNVANISKHQFKNKVPASTSPLTSSIKNISLDVSNDEFKKHLDTTDKMNSPLADTITKLMQKQSAAEIDRIKRGMFDSMSSQSKEIFNVSHGPMPSHGKRVALDANDAAYMYNTLVIDENATMEA